MSWGLAVVGDARAAQGNSISAAKQTRTMMRTARDDDGSVDVVGADIALVRSGDGPVIVLVTLRKDSAKSENRSKKNLRPKMASEGELPKKIQKMVGRLFLQPQGAHFLDTGGLRLGVRSVTDSLTRCHSGV